MKLDTLLEYQHCFDLLRDNDRDAGKPLSVHQYSRYFEAKLKFENELERITKTITVEITGETS